MSTSESPVAESTPSSLFLIDPQTSATSVVSQTPATSVYSPTDVDDPLTSEWKPLEKLNSFLESRDIGPVRHPMKTQWEEASERTKRRHTRKAKQAVDAVLDEFMGMTWAREQKERLKSAKRYLKVDLKVKLKKT